ncbi:MAG: class I SAM-dependent methyltransferase [Gemmatimonadaceae bacterium]
MRDRIKRLITENRESRSPLIRWIIRSLYRTRDALHAVRRFGADGGFRAIVWLKAVRGRQLHQTTVLTWADRYPAIFVAAQAYFAHRPDIRILSFGCSTGEEVVTLRYYFPQATIVGAEINPRSLAVCKARQLDARISFIPSTPRRIRAAGPFDAIFCMAVLQRNPHMVESQGMTSLAEIYPFEKFDAQLTEFDVLLNPAGLLVVHHTQYVVDDAAIASRYSPVAEQPTPTVDGPRFDRSSQLITHPVATPSMYVKARM